MDEAVGQQLIHFFLQRQDHSGPRLCVFYFIGVNFGSIFSMWHAISDDIMYPGEHIHVSSKEIHQFLSQVRIKLRFNLQDPSKIIHVDWNIHRQLSRC